MYVQWYTWGTFLLFLDPCNCELIIFVHLHSNADFIYTPGISSEKNCYNFTSVSSSRNVNICPSVCLFIMKVKFFLTSLQRLALSLTQLSQHTPEASMHLKIIALY